ncbi:hypothetical protein FH972_022130 [Carpinus fangiana]|uniref:Uncharacterized protein n=1 Tax=Carpinus fangiana TaxID=176857 RepID=A0A5N6KRC1_9ROSI|nr:hypothetical protein FH972_022130 [Carpinus fangiana]
MAQTENSPVLKQLASSGMCSFSPCNRYRVEGKPLRDRSLTSSTLVDPEIRSQALTTLTSYLTRPQPFTTLDCLKLHKYLFYAVYMSDGPLAQQQLCTDLACLIYPLPGTPSSTSTTISKDNLLPFLDAFWQTIAREWNRIDRLRMDKYLLLVRLVLRATFSLLVAQRRTRAAEHPEIDLELFEAHMELVSRYPLSAADKEKAVRKRALEVLKDERLTALMGEWPGDESGEEDDSDEEEWDGMEE